MLFTLSESNETAESIADHPVIVKELHRKNDQIYDFWPKQYEDHDFLNRAEIVKSSEGG